MALAQKDVIAGPDAVIMSGGFVRMVTGMPMSVIVAMPVIMPMIMQCVIVCHTGESSA